MISRHAIAHPDRPAVIMAESGSILTFRELDAESARLAQLMHAQGLCRGDHIALFMENHLRFMAAIWAGVRSGLYVTAINRYLTADEASYIITDCGAKVLVTTSDRSDVAASLPALTPGVERYLCIGGACPGFEDLDAALSSFEAAPLEEEWMGDTMLYSSGTTGRPKGVKRPLREQKVDDGDYRHRDRLEAYDWQPDSVYLSPAPMYHAAPLNFSLASHFFGATVVLLEKFDPVVALQAIERYGVTHSQWVPTMFVRMLKLPENERTAFDLSSHRIAIHGAAPCPIDVKHRMIEWWGPILHEYYGATESNGSTRITSQEWLEHPGSVGRATAGIIHICGEDGTELPTGEVGDVYFEREGKPFEYHNDPDKTRSATHPWHSSWSAIGDIGYVDADGYLYLTDRKSFMIISGGVNIYPQEIENTLVMHPKVLDVAVIGVPNAEMGEEVKAVVELAAGVQMSAELAQELIAFVSSRLARYKVPRSVDFVEALPRLPTGKLLKRVVRERYWPAAETAVQ